MSAMSNYLENKIIDWLLRGQAFTPPSSVHVALFTGAPSDSGGGTEVSTSGTGYGRVSIGATLANWAGTQASGSTTASSGTGGATSNNSVVTFGTPTANWGQVTHVALFDASTGGNMLFHGALSQPKTINNGDPAPTFPAASLGISLD